MKRTLKKWNRALLLVTITLLLTITATSYFLIQAYDDHQTQPLPDKPDHTTPPTETTPTEPTTQTINIQTTEDWIQGTHDQTTYNNQEGLKLAQHQTQTIPQRETLNTQPYRITQNSEHLIIAGEGEIQTYNNTLQQIDNYNFFQHGFTTINTKQNRIYAAEIIFRERDHNETLHLIDIQENGELEHHFSQKTERDIGNFLPLNQQNQIFATEHQNQTLLYEEKEDELEIQQTLELEADFTDHTAIQNQNQIHLIGQEFNKPQKSIITIDLNTFEVTNKTQITDISSNTQVTSFEQLSELKFAITNFNNIRIIEKEYAGNNTYEYQTQDHDEFTRPGLTTHLQENTLYVNSATETRAYNIENNELNQKWVIPRYETSNPAGITKIQEELFSVYRNSNNNPAVIERQEPNYQAFRYHTEGTYTSQQFDLGTTQNIHTGIINMERNNQDVEVIVETANNPRFDNSNTQRVTPSGALGRLTGLNIEGRYVQIKIEIEGNHWETPVIEDITLEAE